MGLTSDVTGHVMCDVPIGGDSASFKPARAPETHSNGWEEDMTHAWNQPTRIQRDWVRSTLLMHSAICDCSTPWYHLQKPEKSAWSCPGGAGDRGADLSVRTEGDGVEELLAFVEDEQHSRGQPDGEGSSKENEEKKSSGTGTLQR